VIWKGRLIDEVGIVLILRVDVVEVVVAFLGRFIWL
jgi:hypothetical protein